jgi:hypothetical protein
VGPIVPLHRNQITGSPVVNCVKRRMYFWCSLLVAILFAWVGYKAYQANRNLVTLNVRNADVRDVARKIGWQTWETIVVDNDVKGKVTMNVVKVPLEEVLGIIGDQTSSRPMAVYPIYSKSSSFVNLRKLARGEATHETVGWTNFNTGFGRGGDGRGGRGGGGPGGFGGPGGPGGFGGGPDGVRPQNTLVSINVPGKDLTFATIALSRTSQAQVVPEDGATATISLQLSQVPFTKAVAKVAKQANRKWDVFYTLQGRPDFFADRGDDDERGRRGDRGDRREGEGFRGRGFGEGNTNWEARAEQRMAERERQTEIRLATMTPEEQAKAKEQQQQFEQMRDATPEQRQQFFEQMRNNPQMQQRGENRRVSMLNNSTPDQRVERTRRIAEMRARRGQQGQQGRGR